MEEKVDNEAIQEFLDDRNTHIELAEKMKRLQQNEDFQLLFGEMFVEAYSMTQIAQLHGRSDDSKQKILNGLVSRSDFLAFQKDIVENGSLAEHELAVYHEQVREENEQGQTS